MYHSSLWFDHPFVLLYQMVNNLKKRKLSHYDGTRVESPHFGLFPKTTNPGGVTFQQILGGKSSLGRLVELSSLIYPSVYKFLSVFLVWTSILETRSSN